MIVSASSPIQSSSEGEDPPNSCNLAVAEGRVSSKRPHQDSLHTGYTSVPSNVRQASDYEGLGRLWGFEVRHTPEIGRYLTSSKFIPAGALVIVLPPLRIQRFHEVEDFNRVISLGDGFFSSSVTPEDHDNFLAHSCDATCTLKVHPGFWADLHAARDILPGEPLSFDYEETEEDMIAQGVDFVCECGSSKCRGHIVGWRKRTELELQKNQQQLQVSSQ